ncbi:MAG TPA: glycosyltransferase family 4 protein [Lysobacter sp.]
MLDLYRQHQPDLAMRMEFSASVVEKPGEINVFFINGDEVDQALRALHGMPRGAFNVVYPAWELPVYPQVWLDKLAQFDAVWAPSRFIQDGMAALTSRPVVHQPLACEVRLTSLLDRRYFGIPESSYAFLFFFDLRSYVSRKNPWAVMEAFEKLQEARPWSDSCLVLKLNGSEHDPAAARQLRENIAKKRLRVVLIDETMTDNEIKNLVRCTDCFVSLHRSEGFGRGMAEAMYLGKPVIATNYSGNTDFMDESNSLLVRHELVPVQEGEYPHAQGQVWAQADTNQAAANMVTLVDSPAFGRQLGTQASRQVRLALGYLPSGLRYIDALAGC